MKRLRQWVLMVAFTFSITAFAVDYDLTRTITSTVGVPFTLTPYTELGCSWDVMYEGYTPNYSISDESGILITYVRYGTSSNSSSKGFYSYNMTPLKSGTYMFEYNAYTGYSSPTTSIRITFTINVVEVLGVELSPTLSLPLGESYECTPILIPSSATTTYTWNSYNPDIVSVSSEGIITANSIGTTVITCMTHNGKTANCEVTVSPIIVNKVTLSESQIEVIPGEQRQLTASILPENATNQTLTWSSSNEAVAVVNENGLVTAVGAGMCNITASTKDGSELTASCLVTVLGDVMYCEDLGAVSGATMTLPIQLKNASAIQGFEFELVLPEGVTVETDGNGKLAATLTDRVSTSGLEGARLDNGNYKFVFTSTNRILGTEGAVMNVPLVVAEDMEVGTYNIVVKDVELVKYGTSAQIHHADRMATLTVNAMTMGDVNGDGRISVADAIAIINYVLGRTPVSFIAKAADVNGDESISLADAVAVVDIILGRSGGSVKAASIQWLHNPE